MAELNIEALRLTEEDRKSLPTKEYYNYGMKWEYTDTDSAQLAKVMALLYTVYKSEGAAALGYLLDEAHDSGMAVWESSSREIPSRL